MFREQPRAPPDTIYAFHSMKPRLLLEKTINSKAGEYVCVCIGFVHVGDNSIRFLIPKEGKMQRLVKGAILALVIVSLLVAPVAAGKSGNWQSGLYQSSGPGDVIPPDSPPAGEVAGHDTSGGNGEAVEEKGEFTPGESSSIDAGRNYTYIPVVSGIESTDVNAAATTAAWYTVFNDEFCSFPTGWTRNDYNGTGHFWVYQTVDSLCTAKPNGYVVRMNTNMSRSFSLVGATNAYMTFRYKMTTETGFDFLRYEYSCNSGRTWYGSDHAVSGSYGWTTKTIYLSSCLNSSSVQVRFTFQTDKSINSTMAPTLDYVKVLKYQ